LPVLYYWGSFMVGVNRGKVKDIVTRNLMLYKPKDQLDFEWCIFRSFTCLTFCIVPSGFRKLWYSLSLGLPKSGRYSFQFQLFVFFFSSYFFYSSSIKMAPCTVSLSSLCLGRFAQCLYYNKDINEKRTKK
jgi:hypothetical protein